MNAIRDTEGFDDNDIELAEDLIVTESEVNYYKEMFVGGSGA